jgi:Cu(I)/Ag(I) efflux system membrane fusion protein
VKLKLFICIALASTAGWFASIWFYGTPGLSDLGRSATVSSAKGIQYQCPMHPWVNLGQPSRCTVCGMSLVKTTDSGESPQSGSGRMEGVYTGTRTLKFTSIPCTEARRQPLIKTLRFSGIIAEDETTRAVVCSPVEGRIEGLSMSCEGDEIRPRRPLMTILSSNLTAAANEYKAALEKGGTELDVAVKKLTRYGLLSEQITAIPSRPEDKPFFGIVAHQTGTILKNHVREGQYVREGEPLFDIADFTRMWFTFTAYDQDIPFIQPSQIVRVTLPSLPGESFVSRVDFINPIMDGSSRTARVRVVLENPDRKLKYNSFAQAVLEATAPEVLCLPRSSVLWSGSVPRVYVEKDRHEYRAQMVKLGRAGDALWEVLEGVKEGDRVVVAGNMLLDSQAQLDEMSAESQLTEPLPQEMSMSENSHYAVNLYLQGVSRVNASLANDDLSAANEALKNLPLPPDGEIKHSPPLPATNILELRMAFLPWSQEVADYVLKLKPQITGVKIFRCPMTQKLWSGAPSNAKWIQINGKLGNPYFGLNMKDCGAEITP